MKTKRPKKKFTKSKNNPEKHSLNYITPLSILNPYFSNLSIGPFILIKINSSVYSEYKIKYIDCEIIINPNSNIAENNTSLLKIIDICYSFISDKLRNKLFFMFYTLFLFTHSNLFSIPNALNERILAPDEPIRDKKDNKAISSNLERKSFENSYNKHLNLSNISINTPKYETNPNNSIISNTRSIEAPTSNYIQSESTNNLIKSKSINIDNSSFKPTSNIIEDNIEEFINKNKKRVLNKDTRPPSIELIESCILNASKLLTPQEELVIDNKKVIIRYLDNNNKIPENICNLIKKFKIGDYIYSSYQFLYYNNNIIINLVKYLQS